MFCGTMLLNVCMRVCVCVAAGLRILDISSIPKDPSGKGIKEVAYFDG